MKSLVKKLLSTVAVAVMAFAAFAEPDPLMEGSYSFGVSITKIPIEYAKLSSDAGYYFVNGETHEIVAYLRNGDYATAKSDGVLYTKAGETITLGGQEYTFADQIKVVSDTFFNTYQTADETKLVAFKIYFKTSASESIPDVLNETESSSGTAADLNLFAIVHDPGTEEGYTEYYQEFHGMTYSMAPCMVDFNGAETYANRLMTLEAFSAEKIYDGLPTNATFTVSVADATVTVAYGGSEEGPWGDEEEYDPVKFKDRTDTWARFTATKKGYEDAEAIAYVRVTPRPVMVTAPNLTFPLDAEDDAIDAEIESQIDIEKAGLIPEHGVLDGDEITYKWAREEASYKDGNREEDASYEITFPDEGGYEDYNVTYQYNENYEVCYVPGTLKFEEPEPVACPKCLCLCNCEKRTYNGTIVNNGKEFTGTITLTMKKSSKAGYADVTATVETTDGTFKFKKNGVMICGCRDNTTKTTCTTKCVSKCGIFGFGSLGSQVLAENAYDYSKELGYDVEFYEGWGECTCGCGSDEGHGECKTWKGDCRCYWAKKGRKCHKTCCKYDFGFGKSQCDFSHYDYTGCYKTKVACDWGKIGNDWDKYVCDWSKNSSNSSKKSCTSSKSVCSLFKSFCDSNKKSCTSSKSSCSSSKKSCTSSKKSCCTKKFFCWHKFTCKPVCVKKTTCCKKTTTKLETRCIVLNPLVIEMEQTGLSFRQSATHALTISIVGDDMTGTLHTSDTSYEITGASKVNLTSGDPRAEVAKNVTDTTYVVRFSSEDADVTAGQFTVRVAGDGIVKASGTIDGLSYSGTSDLVINSYGGIEIPVIAMDKKGDIIVFKIDAPAEEEADVVELNIANVSLSKGETLVPAQIEIEEDAAAASAKPYDAVPALYMGEKGFGFIPHTLED